MSWKDDPKMVEWKRDENGVYYAGRYCCCGTRAGCQELTEEQFEAWLQVLHASAREKYSTLYSLEREDGLRARRAALQADSTARGKFNRLMGFEAA